jgi:pyruvate ferredoxin oxidoreductase gamma subunit
MFQVRFHGRGGQGVVTAAGLLASAAFREGRYAQAFPSFGSEGWVPVMSFCRIDDKPIRTREPVTDPDALLIQDPTLLHPADLFAGLKPCGYVLVNAAKGFADLGLADLAARHDSARLLTVPASGLAMARLGRPLPGAPMLAALAGVVSLDAVLAAISDRFTGQSPRATPPLPRPPSITFSRAQGADPCLSRSRVPARSPRRWPRVGRR